jgi:hypothetical protein
MRIKATHRSPNGRVLYKVHDDKLGTTFVSTGRTTNMVALRAHGALMEPAEGEEFDWPVLTPMEKRYGRVEP